MNKVKFVGEYEYIVILGIKFEKDQIVSLSDHDYRLLQSSGFFRFMTNSGELVKIDEIDKKADVPSNDKLDDDKPSIDNGQTATKHTQKRKKAEHD